MCWSPGSSAIYLDVEFAADQGQHGGAVSPQEEQLSRAAPTEHEWSVQFAEAVLADPGVAEALPAK